MTGLKEHTIAILGLGYVGLPLAVAFSKKYNTLGFDINEAKASLIASGVDPTNELDGDELSLALQSQLQITSDPALLASCTTFIITVPTDINPDKSPNLEPLIAASLLVSKHLKKGDLVIYESTTYPGCTEEVCVPILNENSGLIFNQDYTVGYSPERINPGDKQRNVTNILKVTSGSTKEAAIEVDALYNSIITAGTHLAPSIKVAEAAKAIENAQRDVNISFINELALIFDKLEIDTGDVLAAAGTKWNFLPFKPGLVGGHCIGVDPYYLAQKAQEYGYHPEIILAGRRLNDSMGDYVASEVVKLMISKDIPIKNASILVLGITFKENCPDVRNTKAVDVITALKGYGVNITIFDPWANKEEVKKEYQLESTQEIPSGSFDGVVLTVAHKEFLALDFDSITNKKHIIYDVKNILPASIKDGGL